MVQEGRSLWLADPTEPVLESTVGSVLREAAVAAGSRMAVVCRT